MVGTVERVEDDVFVHFSSLQDSTEMIVVSSERKVEIMSDLAIVIPLETGTFRAVGALVLDAAILLLEVFVPVLETGKLALKPVSFSSEFDTRRLELKFPVSQL